MTTRTAPRRKRRPSLRGDAERNALMMANINLVRGFLSSYPWLAKDDDVISAGNFGLLRAAELYDAAKDRAFSTYAYTWIESFVRAELRGRDLIHVPKEPPAAFADDAARARCVGRFGDERGVPAPAWPARSEDDVTTDDKQQIVDLRAAERRLSDADRLFLERRYYEEMPLREATGDATRQEARQRQDGVLRRLGAAMEAGPGLFDGLCEGVE
jgi:RNA polymerase sigma factor (sigma-70 family)